MNTQHKRLQLNRRALLAGTGSVFAAGIMSRATSIDVMAQEALSTGRLFLNPDQAATVEALAEVMWPTTEASAGGRDAGVMYYIDRALAGPYAEYRTVYVVGLEWLDAASQSTHGGAFRDLDEEQQLDIVTQIFDGPLGEISGTNGDAVSVSQSEATPITADGSVATPVATADEEASDTASIDGVIVAGVAPTLVPNVKAFMDVVRIHVMEGLFSDPVHGGNREFAGWAAVGYPGPYVVFNEEQQQSFEPLDLPFQSIADF